MKAGLRRRVDRLAKVVGPCDACAERARTAWHDGARQALEISRQVQANLKDPVWVAAEVDRLDARLAQLDAHYAEFGTYGEPRELDMPTHTQYRGPPRNPDCRRCRREVEMPSAGALVVARNVQRALERSDYDVFYLSEMADFYRSRARELVEQSLATGAEQESVDLDGSSRDGEPEPTSGDDG